MKRRADATMRLLLATAVLGLGVRVAYVAIAERGPCTIRYHGLEGVYHSECTGHAGVANDQVYYNSAANALATGHGFTATLPGQSGPAADHPPLTVAVLSAVSFAFDHAPLQWIADRTRLSPHIVVQTNVREQRYFLALMGALVVLLIGLLTRSLAGDRAAIIAALIAALYPNLWVNDGLIFSETLTNVVVVTALILAVRAWRQPTFGRIAWLGAACGLAALGRAELGLLAPLLVIPIAWSARRAAGNGVALRRIGAGLVAAVIVVAPWVIYNNTRFHDLTFISTNDGLAMGASNCDPVYHGTSIGLTDLTPPCTFTDAEIAQLATVDSSGHHRPADQSEVSAAYRSRAVHYMRLHWKRVPLVVVARVARTWSLWHPIDMISYNEGESRVRFVSWAGLVTFYPLALTAIAGGVLLWRRNRRHLWLLVVPAIALTVGVAITYGQVRFRSAAEPSLVVLAAIAVGWLVGGRELDAPVA